MRISLGESRSPESEETQPASRRQSDVKAFLRRTRLPEILIGLGLVLAVAAGLSMWTQARSEGAATPALAQPTPFPTRTPLPSAVPTTTPESARTGTPVTLPIIPAIPLPSTPVPAASAPTRIVIPSIRLDAPVVEVGWRAVQRGEEMVTEWEVAENAVGFHIGSAYPGNPGNTVLSGHHNIKGKVFRYLVNVEPGAEIILYAEDRAYHYRVESKQILPEKYASDAQRAKNAELIGPFPDERLTLVTCWPYTGSTHRVVVVARPAPPTAGAR